jgi:hypothetical protein
LPPSLTKTEHLSLLLALISITGSRKGLLHFRIPKYHLQKVSKSKNKSFIIHWDLPNFAALFSKLNPSLFFLAALLVASSATQADDGKKFISASYILIEQADPETFSDFFAGTTPKLISGPVAPLARYNPVASDGVMGIVEFGNDLRRYKKEYTIATVIIPKAQRPGFDQYMTVLTALSLANEKAHFEQHKNRSLADFFVYRERGKTAQACALYALQQHASDVTMLDMAVKLLAHFKSIESDFGMNAVTAALDRMGLLQIYWDFHAAAAAKDRPAMTAALKKLKLTRDQINLNAFKECLTTSGTVTLPDAVIKRAIAPAYPYLLTYGMSAQAPLKKEYND